MFELIAAEHPDFVQSGTAVSTPSGARLLLLISHDATRIRRLRGYGYEPAPRLQELRLGEISSPR
jgi:hypothetical protein